MRTVAIVLGLVAVSVLSSGCTMTDKAANFNGLTDIDGQKVGHQQTMNVAVNFLFTKPIWGNASIDQTVSDFTAAAKSDGGKVRITNSDSSTYWYILPPLSFIVHPVVTNVAGDVALK